MSFDCILKPQVTKSVGTWSPHILWAIDIIIPDPRTLSKDQEAEWDDRMISSYPISTIVFRSKGHFKNACVAYNKTGITLRDLLQVAKGILQTESPYNPRSIWSLNDNFVAAIDVLFKGW